MPSRHLAVVGGDQIGDEIGIGARCVTGALAAGDPGEGGSQLMAKEPPLVPVLIAPADLASEPGGRALPRSGQATIAF